jgi:arylsulfatase A-like enzyme
MNILYLHAHDVGRFASVYGVDVETPGLERFAASGATVFNNAHCVAPTCSPSRTALLTGEYPHQQGMLGLAHRGFAMSRPGHHMADWLRRQGYTTALSGVQHEFDFNMPETLPYDCAMESDWSGGTAALDESAADAAVAWLGSHDGKKPFFLSVGFYWPHVPLPDVAEASPCNQIGPWPDGEAGRLDTAALQEAMKHTDACMGRVLEALERSAFVEDTLVLVTTDHGTPFPLNKATLHDRGTGVLFMLRVPGKPGPERTDALVSQLDFFPTVCEAAKLEPPHWLQGESLLPVLGGAETRRDALLLQTNHHVDFEPARAVRTRTHKLIRRFVDGPRSRPNVDASRLKDYVAERRFFDTPADRQELYDLRTDPEERHNLAGDSRYADLIEELGRQLHVKMEQSDDPLLEMPATGFSVG